MNPDTNKFEELSLHPEIDELLKLEDKADNLVRPDGTLVPESWTIFTIGELVVIKNYTFRVAYIGESNILFEPVKPVIINKEG